MFWNRFDTEKGRGESMAKIAVIGSINLDVVNRVRSFPAPGETIHSEGTEYSHGGKGANQAVAAAMAGAQVVMAGAVGTDPYGGQLVASLQGFGVDTALIAKKDGNSGMAFITVDASSQNQIILSEGANGQLTQGDIQGVWQLDDIRAIVLQNEIPWETNREALKQARERGLHVVFNPAPARVIEQELLPCIGTLVLNETEAEFVTGITVGGEKEAVRAAEQLIKGGVGEVIVTLGAQGALYLARDGIRIFAEAFTVQAVDTTAAGDTFIGYYTALRAEGMPAERALKYATAASALAVTRKGAQTSVPAREEVERFLRESAKSKE
jgi:ribokinase